MDICHRTDHFESKNRQNWTQNPGTDIFLKMDTLVLLIIDSYKSLSVQIAIKSQKNQFHVHMLHLLICIADCVKMDTQRLTPRGSIALRVTKKNIPTWEKCQDLCAASCCLAWSYYNSEYYINVLRRYCDLYKTPTYEHYDEKKSRNVISGTKYAVYCE